MKNKFQNQICIESYNELNFWKKKNYFLKTILSIFIGLKPEIYLILRFIAQYHLPITSVVV